MEDQMTNQVKIPTPDQRPDLYDDYDGGGLFRKTGIAVPDRIQKLIDERAAKKAAAPTTV